MRRTRKETMPAAVGGSSLLVIFAVLCLCILSFLGLSTVKAEKKLSDASAANMEAYYRTDCEAEEILARLRAGQIPENVSVSGHTYTYVCPISETQELQAEVRFAEDGSYYDIIRWQTVSTADWNPDDRLEVWDGTSD